MANAAAVLDHPASAVAFAPASSPFRSERVGLDNVPDEAWADLASAAAEPNVFYDPAFARAALPAFGGGVQAIAIWSATRLIGLFPIKTRSGRFGLLPGKTVGWTHPFAPLGAPLIAAGQAEPVVRALLDHLAAEHPSIALLPMLPLAGPFAEALVREVGRRGGHVRVLGRHARAALMRDAGKSASDAVSAKKRKELRRQARRLAEHAAVTFASAASEPDLSAALGEFLRLESGGWKGRAGSAAAQSEAQRRFMHEAVTALAVRGCAEVHSLRLGETAIAAAITLRSGDCVWFWKIAYDEACARASPGVQLTLRLTEQLQSDARIRLVDSCATPDHPMIDHLWGDRIEIGDVLVALPSAPRFTFAAVYAAESLRRRLRVVAKRVRERLSDLSPARRGHT